ncbi:HPF/RaiA family ribosome-associated protein [Altererythrobacter sp. Z27]|uniref:HPF/RaiA family ribosome-associated protein n=1 Tax=Altererythrobacter sp. Z27 TaxID=3461147 RepID=UPI004044DCBA
MQIQFNSDSSVMGTANVAERIEAQLRHRLARYEDRLTRIEVHVSDENARKGGADDKSCTIEARPRSGRAIGVTAHAADVDAAARKAGNILFERLDRVFGKAERHKHDPSPDKVM